MTGDVVARINAEIEAWERGPDAMRSRPEPTQEQVVAAFLAFGEGFAAAMQSLVQTLNRIAREVQPIIEKMQAAQAKAAQPAVPMWAVQPNRQRRTRNR